jgi:hypothetical protein
VEDPVIDPPVDYPIINPPVDDPIVNPPVDDPIVSPTPTFTLHSDTALRKRSWDDAKIFASELGGRMPTKIEVWGQLGLGVDGSAPYEGAVALTGVNNYLFCYDPDYPDFNGRVAVQIGVLSGVAVGAVIRYVDWKSGGIFGDKTGVYMVVHNGPPVTFTEHLS